MATKTSSKPSLVTFLTISYLISTVHVITVVDARNLQFTTMALAMDHSGAGNLMDCWNAGLELKSCTDEIVKFFLSQTGTNEPAAKGGIDEDCCGAIRMIEKDCWSVMFTSLGLTTMEGNNLREYCDFQAEKPELSPSPSPAPEALALSPVEITYPGLN
ncbi:hypothetical protein CARUB_v10028143mg [Capsella rubella]|uniref:Prolamin-like domain-containing protein n=1 Tax=Capsella rubella TaxID=81985 RepID=R0GUG0_9BRAS|nr:egg cell-secreted protein 1.5 [Capsella rubella]EOA14833.1 hypothetical protein CARUB_v10028143mg [Capsella rubella]